CRGCGPWASWSVRRARRPPAILVARPEVAHVGHDLVREEGRVVEYEILRHRADLEQHHEVADAETLDALGELLADRRGAARDHVALLEVLRPVERLANLPGLRADLCPDTRLQRLQCPVAGRFGEALPDVQALLVEVMHVRRIEALGLGVGVGDADELEKSRAIGVVVDAELADGVPETVHRGLAPLVAEVREVAEDVVELRRPLPRLEAPAPG